LGQQKKLQMLFSRDIFQSHEFRLIPSQPCTTRRDQTVICLVVSKDARLRQERRVINIKSLGVEVVHLLDFVNELHLLQMQVLLPCELEVKQLALELACLELVLLVRQKLLEFLRPISLSNYILEVFDAPNHVLEPVVIVLESHILNLALLVFVQVLKPAILRTGLKCALGSLLLIIHSAIPPDVIVVDRAPPRGLTVVPI
jgi:hypothetical protein